MAVFKCLFVFPNLGSFFNHKTFRIACVLITQSCWTLCDLMVCSPLGFSANGILQARILEWVAISPPGIFLIQGSKLALLHCRQIPTIWATKTLDSIEERKWSSQLRVAPDPKVMGAKREALRFRATGRRWAQDGRLFSSLPGSISLQSPTSFQPQGLFSVPLSANLLRASGIYTGYSLSLQSHCWAEMFFSQGHLHQLFRQSGLYNTYHNHDGVTVSITIYIRPVSLPNQSSKTSRVLSVFFFTIIPSN